MATEQGPLAFPPDFARQVIRRAQREERQSVRRRVGVAGLALLLGVAGISLWRHEPVRPPVGVADSGASRAWLHSLLFVGAEERGYERAHGTEDDPLRSSDGTGLNEVSETLFR
jgi:hypothetical protein